MKVLKGCCLCEQPLGEKHAPGCKELKSYEPDTVSLAQTRIRGAFYPEDKVAIASKPASIEFEYQGDNLRFECPNDDGNQPHDLRKVDGIAQCATCHCILVAVPLQCGKCGTYHTGGCRLIEPQSDRCMAEAVSERPQPTGRKFDTGKLRYGLIDVYAKAWLAGGLLYGCAKYSAENWRQVPDARERYSDALDRHLEAWKSGQDDDEETGLPHLALASCNLMFLTALCAPRDIGVVISRTQEAIRRLKEIRSKA